MAARYVVDTNLLVYALDRREPENEPVGHNEARLLKTRYHRVGFRLTLEYPVDRFEGLIYPVSAAQRSAVRRKFRALAEGETWID